MRVIRRLAPLLACLAVGLAARADPSHPADAAAVQSATGSPSALELRIFNLPDAKIAATPEVSQHPILPAATAGDLQTLDPFLVFARRVLPKEKDVLTDYGRLQLAKRRYTSELYRGTFGPLSQIAAYYFNFLAIAGGWHPNDAEAMTLYRESERVQVLKDFDDLSRLERFRDPKQAKELLQIRQELWRTGLDSLYWNASGPTGILIGGKKR